MSEVQEIITPEGRIVAGHPMVVQNVTDDNNVPVRDAQGVQKTESYFALAIPKQGETDWKQLPWGQQIVAAAQAGWPNGEFNAPTFSWKVADGDSQVPNTKGKKPCDREGWPGCWVVHLKTMMNIACFHEGKFDPMQQIQDKNEIKPGDYGRVFITCKANNPSKSPGVYLNPKFFSLMRAGQLIQLDSGPSAAEAFGGGSPAPAPQAAPNPAPQPQVTPPSEPHRDFVNGPPVTPPPAPAAERRFDVGGNQYTESQLKGFGWSPEQIAQHAKPL